MEISVPSNGNAVGRFFPLKSNPAGKGIIYHTKEANTDPTIHVYVYFLIMTHSHAFPRQVYSSYMHIYNPIALKMAKIPKSFDHSECNRVKLSPL